MTAGSHYNAVSLAVSVVSIRTRHLSIDNIDSLSLHLWVICCLCLGGGRLCGWEGNLRQGRGRLFSRKRNLRRSGGAFHSI